MKLKMDYKWVALTVTTIGAFMASLDSSIIVIGLPTVLKDLNANITEGVWIITGYRLMMTLLLVLFGHLADRYGRVKLYNLGFAVFTLGSLCCGFSTTGTLLVASRLLQGSGAALLTANSAAIITDAFGWRSMFLINVPIGIIATFWGYKTLKEISIKTVHKKFDYAGSVLYSVALLTMLYALTIGQPLSPGNLSILGVGFVLFLAVVFVELRQEHPVLDIKLFKIRLFAAGSITGFFNSLAFNCGPFLRSLYLQLVMGYSPLDTGAMLIPLNIVVFIVSPISGRFADKYGGRWLSSIGLALNAIALFWFASLNINSTYTTILVSLIIFGFGRALFASPNSASVMGSVPPEKRGMANGVRMTINQTGNVLSVPFSLLLMTLVMPFDRLTTMVSGDRLTNPDDINLFLSAVNRACLILGIITLVAIIPSLLRGPKTETAAASPEKA